MTCFFIWIAEKKPSHLHRYPENNLFTLKKLIPIENRKGVFVKRFLFFIVGFNCFSLMFYFSLYLVAKGDFVDY